MQQLHVCVSTWQSTGTGRILACCSGCAYWCCWCSSWCGGEGTLEVVGKDGLEAGHTCTCVHKGKK